MRMRYWPAYSALGPALTTFGYSDDFPALSRSDATMSLTLEYDIARSSAESSAGRFPTCIR